MTRPIKGILIDPFACTVTEVEHDASSINGIYRLLSHPSMPVSTFTIVQLDDGDAIFVDDEGLLKTCDRFFVWAGYHQPIAGKGLILGSNRRGDSVSCEISVDDARAMVMFAERAVGASLIRTTTPWVAPAELEHRNGA
jgi:hypothetical protein